MRSALECLMEAARCEEMARASLDAIDRKALLETARIWRSLGKAPKKTADPVVAALAPAIWRPLKWAIAS